MRTTSDAPRSIGYLTIQEPRLTAWGMPSKPKRSQRSDGMEDHKARPDNKGRRRDLLISGFKVRKSKPGHFQNGVQTAGTDPSSNAMVALQIRDPPPAPQGPPFDSEGRHVGDSYKYSGVTGGLVKCQPTDLHSSGHRDVSNGSTQVHTGTNWYGGRDIGEDGDEDDGDQPDTKPSYVSLPRRPVSMSPVARPSEMSIQTKSPSDAERLRQLLHIERNVFGTLQNHPELQKPEDGTAEKALERILDDYERLSKPSVGSQSQMGPFLSNSEILQQHDQLRVANTSLQDRNDELREDYAKLKASESRLQDKIVKMDGEYKTLQRRLSQDTEAFNRHIADLQFQKSQLESSHSAKIRKDYNAKQSELEVMKRMHEESLRKMKEIATNGEHEALRRQESDRRTIEQLNRKYDGTVGEWRARYAALEEVKRDLEHRLKASKAEEDTRVRETEEKWERKIQRTRKEQEDHVSNLQLEITRLNKIIEDERCVKDNELRSQEKKLKERHEEETVNLRTVIEDFKVASSRREHFKGLTDSEMAAQYKRLANNIEDVSRLEWDYLKEHQWPLTDSRMRELSKNTRKLKQQIVQHVVWMCLFDYIFCSPFRVMGEDGRELDTNFASIYSSGASSYHWPDVPPDIERTRFEAAKAFLDAVDPSAGDSAAKKSFEASIISTMDAICRALVQVATVQAKDRKRLEGVVRSAAKTWLESCSQRYRLIVVLPEGSSRILTSAFVDDGALSLVVRPDVKRYGDSYGKDLMRGEPLAGWKGFTENYGQ
ncbi:hypothetical protein FB567DRAFT_21848 [Paraphoma chrysanthemicola]|uniref:Uncharacterized protein n=1 Tax=Paraphoma chrysanthemicola TaxID=798071 RepID=A0A8K0W4C5_9PLEO|nr:hypothetical protein FB567DRAFT_21848 [Paraphoma chrysanthemicola]